METKDHFDSRAEQENKNAPDSKAIGAKAFSVQEKLANPFHVLSDRTIQAIINAAQIDKDDAALVRAEIEDRKKADNFHPEKEEIGIKDDLDGHYFGFSNGRIMVPTSEYVDYREAEKRGENRGVFKGQTRETVSEYMENEKEREQMRAFKRDIDAYFENEEHLAKAKALLKARGIEDEAAGLQEIKDRIIQLDKSAGELSRSRITGIYSSYYQYSFRNNRIPDLSNDVGVKRFFERGIAGRAAVVHDSDKAIQNRDVVDAYCGILKTTEASKMSYVQLDKSYRQKEQELRSSILRSVGEGSFLPKLAMEKPEEVRAFLEPLNIDRNELFRVVMNRVFEASSHRKRAEGCIFAKKGGDEKLFEAYDGLFDISGMVADSFAHNLNGYVDATGRHHDSLRICRDEDGKLSLNMDFVDGLSAKAIERINARANSWVGEIQKLESHQEKVEASKNRAVKELGALIASRIDKESDPASILGPLMNIKTIDASMYYQLPKRDRKCSEEFEKLVKSRLPGLVAEVDARPLARQAILERIGVGGKAANFLRLENFREIKDELGLSFEDDDEYDLAFKAFIRTILAADDKNRGFADAAAYYIGIFSEDPERFTAKINEYREECNPKFKRKISSFLNHYEEYQEYVKQRKEQRRLKLERSEVDNDAVLEATSYEEVAKYIEERKKALLEELAAKTEDADTVFAPDTRTGFGGNLVDVSERSRKAPSDFGISKIEKLNGWSKYLELNIDPDTQHYARRFFDGSEKLSAIDDPNTYHAITFRYEGHLCAIAESFSNDSSAMFVARADEDMKPEELLEKMFESSKSNARKQKDIGVERYYHYEDDLDEMYRKAFAYLYSGTRASNVKEAEKIAHHTLYDESEMGNINEGELPPQWPFI